jgi:hypothetical protein
MKNEAKKNLNSYIYDIELEKIKEKPSLAFTQYKYRPIEIHE